jgi:acetoacetyl-CoA reductase
VREAIIATIPVGRLGTAEEFGAAVAYVASDQAAFMTGANLSINGGLHMH